MRRYLLIPLLLFQSASAGIVADVRAAIAKKDFALAEKTLNAYRASKGADPEMIEALSWLGRGALASKQLDKARAYATETQSLVLAQLKTRALDADKQLPIALGAAIEVQANVLAERGERGEAVTLLVRELKTYWNTSIRTRIQKNLNLLSLEGKQAPPLDTRRWLGPKPPSPAELKGRPVLLFFWAHWCPDCKAQIPALVKLQQRYADKGLVLIGPTQRYGFAQRGREVPPDEELRYIDEVRTRSYGDLANMPAPVSEEDFKNYGASTVPTLVLIDRQGIVRMYHPGQMPYEELAAKLEALPAR